MKRHDILKSLERKRDNHEYLIGASVGSGLTAKNAEESDVDFLLILSSGIYRQRGVSSYGAYLSSSNSNEEVLKLYQHEIWPRNLASPLILGLFASDPTIDLDQYMDDLIDGGVAGITNYPTVTLIDGRFRSALESRELGFMTEVKLLEAAKKKGLFTVAFVHTLEEALTMQKISPDILCLHLGLTTGGSLGAKKISSLQSTHRFVLNTFKRINKQSNQFFMIYGGPIDNAPDTHFIFNNNPYVDGYIGGSVFERIPSEHSFKYLVNEFRNEETRNYLMNLTDDTMEPSDYIRFIKSFIDEHYASEISLSELADLLHLSTAYLSRLFKKEIGISFTEYVVNYRLNLSKKLLRRSVLSLKEVAQQVGYPNYSHFSKLFKKYYGQSPSFYRKSYKDKD
ncbi:phosphoenolpyruvate hydrolase family protein [Aerococcus sp. UMB7834]|uniref:phosphoenolpyruvate hydrolase family protein n=1 Tax=Aerococcus sp. UMB7834 TaxID=3046342 RepID=UPI00254DD6F8|nr:phosphoenolpyruvate hydrolase family protein [Aerococcus sp. UMB7834]MDK6804295.1 phosphoenolpyruvate hydrolase family protein [Aerococcus sp. UMB7834]